MSMRRMTSFAVVERIVAIHPHRDPRIERLEVLELSSGVRLVTGKHYRVGDLGVYLRPGCLIPGLLAEQLWLVGKQRAAAWFEVRAMPIGLKDAPDELKEPSLGLWAGEWYKHDNTAESVLAWNERGTVADADGYTHWKFWRPEWAAGHCLDGHFGIVEAVEQPKGTKHDPRFKAPRIRRRSSKAEQRLAKPQGAPEAAVVTSTSLPAAAEGFGSSPAAGSPTFEMIGGFAHKHKTVPLD